MYRHLSGMLLISFVGMNCYAGELTGVGQSPILAVENCRALLHDNNHRFGFFEELGSVTDLLFENRVSGSSSYGHIDFRPLLTRAQGLISQQWLSAELVPKSDEDPRFILKLDRPDHVPSTPLGRMLAPFFEKGYQVYYDPLDISYPEARFKYLRYAGADTNSENDKYRVKDYKKAVFLTEYAFVDSVADAEVTFDISATALADRHQRSQYSLYHFELDGNSGRTSQFFRNLSSLIHLARLWENSPLNTLWMYEARSLVFDMQNFTSDLLTILEPFSKDLGHEWPDSTIGEFDAQPGINIHSAVEFELDGNRSLSLDLMSPFELEVLELRMELEEQLAMISDLNLRSTESHQFHHEANIRKNLFLYKKLIYQFAADRVGRLQRVFTTIQRLLYLSLDLLADSNLGLNDQPQQLQKLAEKIRNSLKKAEQVSAGGD